MARFYRKRMRPRRRTFRRNFKRRKYAVHRPIVSKPELKWIASQRSGPNWGYGPGANFVVQFMNGPVVGSRRDQRVGTRIRNVSIFVNIQAECNPAVGASRGRFILFMDRSSNGNAPTITDLFADTTPGNVNDYYSSYNLNYVGKGKRYKILFDQSRMLQVEGGANDVAQRHVIKKRIKLRSHTYFNDGSTGFVADISRNAIYLYCTQDRLNNGGVCNIEWQFMYVDV